MSPAATKGAKADVQAQLAALRERLAVKDQQVGAITAQIEIPGSHRRRDNGTR